MNNDTFALVFAMPNNTTAIDNSDYCTHVFNTIDYRLDRLSDLYSKLKVLMLKGVASPYEVAMFYQEMIGFCLIIENESIDACTLNYVIKEFMDRHDSAYMPSILGIDRVLFIVPDGYLDIPKFVEAIEDIISVNDYKIVFKSFSEFARGITGSSSLDS